MKKIEKSSELLWVFGVLLIALGVALCSKADLGVSMIAAPAFVVFDAISPLWSGFSVGVVEYLLQGILLTILCILIGKFRFRYLLAFVTAVIYGYVLNLFLWLMKDLTIASGWARYLLLILGDAVTAFGVACFFKTYLPQAVHELFVAEFAKRFSFPIAKVKCIFDISLLVISITLAFVLFGDAGSFDWSTIPYKSFHSIGLGTLITTAINSPLIHFSSRLIDQIFDPSPRFEKLKRSLNA